MAKKGGKSSGYISSGKTKTINKAREEKRQKKFAEKRAAGKAYVYKPIPKDAPDYTNQSIERAEKNRSKKTGVAHFTSVMRKLDNELNKQRLALKEKAGKSNARKNKTPMSQ